jgi:hypothetical protein
MPQEQDRLHEKQQEHDRNQSSNRWQRSKPTEIPCPREEAQVGRTCSAVTVPKTGSWTELTATQLEGSLSENEVRNLDTVPRTVIPARAVGSKPTVNWLARWRNRAPRRKLRPCLALTRQRNRATAKTKLGARCLRSRDRDRTGKSTKKKSSAVCVGT